MASLRNRTPVRVQSFNAGQQSAYQPTVVSEGGASEITNSIISNLGQVQQRLGLVRQGDNPDTLVSHWTFDASSSVDDKGSLDGTDTDITYVDGKFGKCASFNGSTSKITIDADTTIDATSMGDFSLSAWIYVDSDGEKFDDVERFFGDDGELKMEEKVKEILHAHLNRMITEKIIGSDKQ